jgi:DNA-directed RNA polymerase subunit RPC12/RpoP
MRNDGLLCWSCGKPTGLTKVGRSDECPNCLAALLDKEKANFCDFYQFRNMIKTAGGISSQKDSKDTRKKSFDDLFNDKD